MDNKIIYDLVQEVREDQALIKKEVTEHNVLFREHLKQDEDMYREIQVIKETLSRNTLDVEKHILRTNLLQDDQKKIIETLDSIRTAFDAMTIRIEKLEEPVKAQKYLYEKWTRIAKIITVTGSAAAVISKYLGWW